MNKKLSALLVGTFLVSSLNVTPAKADVMQTLKDYGIPCALSIGLSAALVKNDGAMIGTAICAGVSSATYLSKQRSLDNERLAFAAEQAVAKSADERDIRIKEDLDSKIEGLKVLIREVLAERLVKMEEDVRSSVEKKLESGDALPKLEERLAARFKEEIKSDSNSRKKEIVKEAVEEVIRQVIAKPVAAPTPEE